MFYLIFLTVFILQLWLVWRFWFRHIELFRQHKKTVLLILCSLFTLVCVYVAGRYGSGVPLWLYYGASLSIGVIFFLFCGSLIYALSSVPFSRERRESLTRLRQGATLLLTTGYASAAGFQGMDSPILSKTAIAIPKLNTPLTIVQISDMHIGGLIDRIFVQECVGRINALNADMVVITGDLTDASIGMIKQDVAPLGELKSRYGTYCVPGNHEYYHGLEATLRYLESLGIQILQNRHETITHQGEPLQIVGVNDIAGYRMNTNPPDINRAMEGVNPDHPVILLAHQPRFVKEAEKYPIDLMISGHTHGGQIFPFHLLVKLAQPYLSGLYRHNPDMQVFVSNGCGFWGPPMRMLAPAEINVLTLG